VGRGLDGFSAAALTKLRRDRGLTQDALAERAGLLQTNICGLERGRHRPSIHTVHALARALGVAPDVLFAQPPPNPLVRLRIKADLTQREAAALLGLPISSYAMLEHPDAEIPPAATRALSAAVKRRKDK
jgi:transcriptional regulator with XRE-family HTH domain